MAINHRSMRRQDVEESVEIVRAHSVLGPRFGDSIHHLKAVWLGLLGQDAFRAVVFEDSSRPDNKAGGNIIGVGVSCFVSDDFMKSLKKPPFRWLVAQLTEQTARGESPLLSNRQLRDVNRQGGLNLIVWVGAVRDEFLNRVDTDVAIISAFVEEHRGYLLKELTGNSMTREVLEATLRSGMMLLCENSRYVEATDRQLDAVFREPHLLGLTRELAVSRIGTWLGSLFVYEPPKCGFRRSEQRLLLAALRGGTDQELACELGISLSAVKKAWLSVYEQVSICLPALLSGRNTGQEGGERGREKKQRLLAYLREHPEELRPAAL